MRLALGALLLGAVLAARAESPVAFVADIQGNAMIEGDGQLTFLAELPKGTRLLLGTGATAAITYAASGAEFTISGPGEFRVSEREVAADRGTQPRRRTVAALGPSGAVARAAQTASASTRMRGLAPAAAVASPLEFPVSTRVSTLKPTLRWRTERADGEYTVALLDADGKELWRGKERQGRAQPPVTLAPASRYSWTVAGARGSVGRAEFETLGAEALKRAEKSSAEARGFSDRVVRALLLQEVGAEQEARETWAELARERPNMPELSALAR